jgi:hypothetical protein
MQSLNCFWYHFHCWDWHFKIQVKFISNLFFSFIMYLLLFNDFFRKNENEFFSVFYFLMNFQFTFLGYYQVPQAKKKQKHFYLTIMKRWNLTPGKYLKSHVILVFQHYNLAISKVSFEGSFFKKLVNL